MKLQLLAWILLGAALSTASAYGIGLWVGHARGSAETAAKVEEARQEVQSDLYKLGERIARMGAELEQTKVERDRNAEELENAARADPGASRRVPTPDSLQRLQQRWGAP